MVSTSNEQTKTTMKINGKMTLFDIYDWTF